ncbi:putative gustatory receptor 93c [Drosophila hydei]|uniref:Gustatory receptor n=1 Tax=Drosophila hydei TaxID=7224 RepID=A0A6J2SRS2_DROHY|nr:putative gustatory receptor 93c [Drosophila hydei]
MFGSRQWRVSTSSISSSILRGSLKYATLMGIICFSVKNDGSDGRLVAKNRKSYKWFCLISRILMCGLYVDRTKHFIYAIRISPLKIIVGIRFFICVICAIFTLGIQFWHGQRVVDVANRFLRLFQRIHALPGCQDMGYGGKRVLGLLFLKVICLVYEACYLIPLLISDYNVYAAITIFCDFYNTANTTIILHIYFVAYLSIGISYDQVNSYVRHELRRQLSELNTRNRESVSRKNLKAAGHCLDECLAIYDEIHQLEMFLCRLNYNEFRVRPLGLFEVSNELILVFMSALVTYITYIVQYDMQANLF